MAQITAIEAAEVSVENDVAIPESSSMQRMLVERAATDQTMHTGSSVVLGRNAFRGPWRDAGRGGSMAAKDEDASDEDAGYFFGDGASSDGKASDESSEDKKQKRSLPDVVSLLLMFLLLLLLPLHG